MMRMKRGIILLLALLCCLLSAGCGGAAGPQAPAEPEQEAASTPDPTPEPTPAPAELRFPNGKVYQGYEVNIDLSGLSGADVRETIALLREMPNLRYVDLGRREGLRGLSFYRISQLQRAFPDVSFFYRFDIWGKEATTLDTELDLKYVPMEYEGDLVIHALRCMPNCRSLDMDSCGVSSEAMARIREAFPLVEVNWRVWFGKEFSVRTDAERIIAPNHLTDDNCQDLRYCTKVRFLDIGHNPNLSDISFLTDMTDMEVCILAIMPYRDLTPLTNLTKMEYLELCEVQEHRGKELDLAPLAGMTKLRHLNICKLYEVKNYEFLENCKELERLWIGKLTYIPEEYIEHLKEALPDTKINWWTQVCVTESWREEPEGVWVPRYAQLRQQFDYNHFDQAISYWWNDPLCQGDPAKTGNKKA